MKTKSPRVTKKALEAAMNEVIKSMRYTPTCFDDNRNRAKANREILKELSVAVELMPYMRFIQLLLALRMIENVKAPEFYEESTITLKLLRRQMKQLGGAK